jgi:hypothetical protein
MAKVEHYKSSESVEFGSMSPGTIFRWAIDGAWHIKSDAGKCTSATSLATGSLFSPSPTARAFPLDSRESLTITNYNRDDI